MEIEVELEKTDTRKLEMEPGATVEQAVRALDLRPDSYVVLNMEKIVPLDRELSHGDKIRLLKVLSGG